MKSCAHDLCPDVRCFYARPNSIEERSIEPPMWALEKSGVRVGQRYMSWQFGSTCRILAVGLSTFSDRRADEAALVAFVDEDGDRKGVTFFMSLRDFTGYIGKHKKRELIGE